MKKHLAALALLMFIGDLAHADDRPLVLGGSGTVKQIANGNALGIEVLHVATSSNLAAATASSLTMSGAIDLGTHQIHNVVDPTSAQDAATQAYVLAHAGGGGGITNTAPNLNLMLSNGTNAVTSGENDDGTTFTSSRKILVGGGTQFSASTLYSFNGISATTTNGFVLNDASAHTVYEDIPLMVWCSTCTYNTTAQASTYWGQDIEITPTHSGGANPLTVVGLHINSQILSSIGGDTVFPIYTEPGAGVSVFKDGIQAGAGTNFTSTANVVTTLTTGAVGSPKFTADGSGNIKLASGGNITQNGTPTASTNIFGDLTMFGDPTLTGNNAYFSSNSLNGEWDSNATDHLNLNFAGYHNSTTQFRDLNIYNGKNTLTAKLTASTGEFYSTLLRTGGATGSRWQSGTGVPALSCSIGDLFSRTDGGATTSLYVCTSANTWTAK